MNNSFLCAVCRIDRSVSKSKETQATLELAFRTGSDLLMYMECFEEMKGFESKKSILVIQHEYAKYHQILHGKAAHCM